MTAGRVALITGASRGIGAAIAVALAEQGCDVAIGYHSNQAAAERVATAVESSGSRALLLRGDVRDSRDCVQLVQSCVQELGGLNVLVSSATGIPAARKRSDHVPTGRTPALDTSWDLYQESLMARTGALLSLARAAAPHLQPQGSIVAITSLGAGRVIPGYAIMGVAMAATESLARYLAYELGPLGIRVNVVQAGAVDTEALSLVVDDPDLLRASVGKHTPLGRLASPADVAQLVTALVGGQCDWMTGHVLVADGGAALRI